MRVVPGSDGSLFIEYIPDAGGGDLALIGDLSESPTGLVEPTVDVKETPPALPMERPSWLDDTQEGSGSL